MFRALDIRRRGHYHCHHHHHHHHHLSTKEQHHCCASKKERECRRLTNTVREQPPPPPGELYRPLVLFSSLFRTRRTPFLAHSFIPFNPSQRSRNHFRVFRFVVNIMSLFCDVDARRCWRFDDEKDQNC